MALLTKTVNEITDVDLGRVEFWKDGAGGKHVTVRYEVTWSDGTTSEVGRTWTAAAAIAGAGVRLTAPIDALGAAVTKIATWAAPLMGLKP